MQALQCLPREVSLQFGYTHATGEELRGFQIILGKEIVVFMVNKKGDLPVGGSPFWFELVLDLAFDEFDLPFVDTHEVKARGQVSYKDIVVAAKGRRFDL